MSFATASNDKKHQQSDNGQKNTDNIYHTTPKNKNLAESFKNNYFSQSLSRTSQKAYSLCSCDGNCPRCRNDNNGIIPPLPFIQTKLKISRPGDKYEQEADRVAEQIVNMSSIHKSRDLVHEKDKTLNRDCARCQEDGSRRLKMNKTENENLYNDFDNLDKFAKDICNVTGKQGKSLDATTRNFMEARFGYDFGDVRIHADDDVSSRSADSVNALAYTVGNNIVFGRDHYSPTTKEGKILLAHELTHIVQQKSISDPTTYVHRSYGTPIPDVSNPTVRTMRQFIDLVRRIESANPGKNTLEIAQMIMRTKYHGKAWDYLLPSSSSTASISPVSGVTSNDITTLSGEFTVELPQGGQSDPSHVVVAIVAGAEKQSPGAGSISSIFITSIPSGISQLDIATWTGDPASAAANWMLAYPHPHGGKTMQSYMDEYSPESDMIADIDGVAMTSSSSVLGFVFDFTTPLSQNLERFYYPISGTEGKNRRFHIFCKVMNLPLENNGKNLSSSAIGTIDNKVKLNSEWFMKNDPDLIAWMTVNSNSRSNSILIPNSIVSEWVKRGNDWRWFAQKFREFVERNLINEGP